MTPIEFKAVLRERLGSSWPLFIAVAAFTVWARTQDRREQAEFIAEELHEDLCAIRSELAEINARARRLQAGEQ